MMFSLSAKRGQQWGEKLNLAELLEQPPWLLTVYCTAGAFHQAIHFQKNTTVLYSYATITSNHQIFTYSIPKFSYQVSAVKPPPGMNKRVCISRASPPPGISGYSRAPQRTKCWVKTAYSSYSLPTFLDFLKICC